MRTLSWIRLSERQSRRARQALMLVVLTGLVGTYFASGVGQHASAQSRDQAALLKGTASLTGTVDATMPFKAAQVFIRNVDKRMVYMVYTSAGRFRAVALLPGNYEVNVQARGLESDVQKLVVKAGDRPDLKFSLRDAPTPDRFPSAAQIPARR